MGDGRQFATGNAGTVRVASVFIKLFPRLLTLAGDRVLGWVLGWVGPCFRGLHPQLSSSSFSTPCTGYCCTDPRGNCGVIVG